MGILLQLSVWPTFVLGGSPPTPALRDNMDGQKTILQPLPGKVRTEVIYQAIDRQFHRFGSGSERLRIACPAGNSAYLAYQLPNTPVLNELRFASWVMCNRPGMQLAANVVLPRSKDPSTGKPFEILVRGGSLGRGSGWEQLTLAELPKAVARMTRVARAQYGNNFDERGAYVSKIVILIPGGRGLAECLIDQIEVYGIIGARSDQASTAKDSIPRMPKKEFQIPQIIQWQGEPFGLLEKLGFDVVGMKRLPSSEEIVEARRLGLKLMCPPPLPQQITPQGISDNLADIYAWDLGEQLSSEDLDRFIRWQELIKRFDPIDSRPVLIAPRLFTREASRLADVLLFSRTMIGTKTSLQDYATWLTQRRRLARPGTDIWTTLDTQLSPTQALQSAASYSPSLSSASYQQLAELTSATFAVRCQGFYYSSHTSLAANDSATQQRAMAIRLNNLRLDLAEPWLASGKVLEVARSSRPQLNAVVLKSERSHLLVPIHWSSSMLAPIPDADVGRISFTVPGAGESSEAYLLTLGGTQRIRHRRVTGGVRITLESLPSDAFVLLTDDPQAFSQVARYLRKIAPVAARLRRDLVAQRLQNVKLSQSDLANLAEKEQFMKVVQRAALVLQSCDKLLAQGSNDLAYFSADKVDNLLNEMIRLPASGVEASRPLFSGPRELEQTLARTPVGENLLVGGGFENLPALLKAGWRHRQLPIAGIRSTVRLSPRAPNSGSYCLELEAKAEDESAPPPVVQASPVWITTAPVHVRTGQIVEITGVARVPEPLIGTVDGLQVIDSLGGPEMALRIPEAPSWQRFRIIRVVPSDGEVTVSIALSGLGKAQIDDLAIRTTTQTARK